MIAVDTNVLVRILVDDPGAVLQMQSARNLLAQSGVLFVPQIVQVAEVLHRSGYVRRRLSRGKASFTCFALVATEIRSGRSR